MAVAKNGARAGAAALLFGLALTASPTVATADDGDGASTTAGTAGASSPSTAAVAARESTPGARPENRERAGPPRRAASRQPNPSTAERTRIASAVSTELRARPPERAPQNTPGTADRGTMASPAATEPPDRIRPQRTAGTTSPPTTTPTPEAASAAAASSAVPTNRVPTALQTDFVTTLVTANPVPVGTAPIGVVSAEPAPAEPAAVTPAVMSAATGTAAVTVADLFTGLLAPIRELFEGAALLVRRTFFNQAPTLSPVQLSGQGEGPITGTIGAVDPEGDPIVYSIATDPRYGSVVVDAAGSYTYTPGPGFTGTDSFIATATDTGFGINLLDLFRAPGTTGNVTVSQGALADLVQFQFVYGDGAQFWSTAARSSLEYVATTLASTLVVTSPVVLTYTVTGEFDPFSSTLASAGSDLVSYDPGFLQTVAQKKILSGIDPNGSASDGTISWNFGPGWAFGDSVPGNQYDFQSTAMHELLHTLGFLSYVDEAGANTGRIWTDFDSHLVTSDGTAVIDGDYVWNTAYNSNLTGGNGGLYFGGPNAVAAYGGLVPIYTPRSWSAGSSMSHLDDSTFVGANRQLMNARSGTGPGIRIISPIEAAVLQDLGYTMAPGPGVSALMFVGLVLFRRRRDGADRDEIRRMAHAG